MLLKTYDKNLLLLCFPGPDEQKFMEASLAYAAGKSNMSDAEFDALKLKLKVVNAIIIIISPYF